MKPTKIFFQKNFPVAQFQFEHYGIEMTLDEGDSMEDGFKAARNAVFEQYKKDNPQITWNEQPIIGQYSVPPPPADTEMELAVQGLYKSNGYKNARPKDRTEAIIFDIGTCSEMKVLESYAILAKNNPKIKEAYDKKKKELI